MLDSRSLSDSKSVEALYTLKVQTAASSPGVGPSLFVDVFRFGGYQIIGAGSPSILGPYDDAVHIGRAVFDGRFNELQQRNLSILIDGTKIGLLEHAQPAYGPNAQFLLPLPDIQADPSLLSEPNMHPQAGALVSVRPIRPGAIARAYRSPSPRPRLWARTPARCSTRRQCRFASWDLPPTWPSIHRVTSSFRTTAAPSMWKARRPTRPEACGRPHIPPTRTACHSRCAIASTASTIRSRACSGTSFRAADSRCFTIAICSSIRIRSIRAAAMLSASRPAISQCCRGSTGIATTTPIRIASSWTSTTTRLFPSITGSCSSMSRFTWLRCSARTSSSKTH